MLNTYEELLVEAEKEGLTVIEKNFKSKAKGLCKGYKVGIRKDLSISDKTCTLAEEMGHVKLTVGDILDLNNLENTKQEYKARLYSYNKLIGLKGLIDARLAGCQDKHEMADYLNVTYNFLEDAIQCYKSKYGVSTKVDNYTIFFEPNLLVYSDLY